MNTIAMAQKAVEVCEELLQILIVCSGCALSAWIAYAINKEDDRRMNAFNWLLKFALGVFLVAALSSVLKAGVPS